MAGPRGGGLLALYGLGCLLAAAIIGLAVAVAAWLAALIIGAGLLAAAGIAALAGRAELRKAKLPVPERAVDSVRADVEEINENAHRGPNPGSPRPALVPARLHRTASRR